MDIIGTAKKGKHLNTLEKYHIHRLSRDKLHMIGTHIDTHNPIFETLRELNTRRQHIPVQKQHQLQKTHITVTAAQQATENTLRLHYKDQPINVV
jgi:hypothetical protein